MASNRPNRRSRWRLPTAHALAVTMLATLVPVGTADAAAPTVGVVAPPLVEPLLDGGEVDLAREHGHITIVHFWATWCPPCRAEMAVLDQFARSHPIVRVIAVSTDMKRDADAVRHLMVGMAYPTVMTATARPTASAFLVCCR